MAATGAYAATGTLGIGFLGANVRYAAAIVTLRDAPVAATPTATPTLTATPTHTVTPTPTLTYGTIAAHISVRSRWFRARMLARTGSVPKWASAVIPRIAASTKLALWEDDLRFAPDPEDLKKQAEAQK